MALPRARLGQRCCGEKMQSLEARVGQGEPKPGHTLSKVHRVSGLTLGMG